MTYQAFGGRDDVGDDGEEDGWDGGAAYHEDRDANAWEDDEWDGEDDDDEEYDDFIAREFPEHRVDMEGGSGWRFGSGSSAGLAMHWRWTAWGILVLLAIFWVFSLL